MSEVKEEYPFVDYASVNHSGDEMIARSQEFFEAMDSRRSVRDFSSEPVPREVIENIIKTASTAPSGAHKQPWTFCLISNKELKSKIRELAEEEEKISYGGRMSDRWIKDLKPLGTTWEKEFIDIVPWIVVIFKRAYEVGPNGEKYNNYYVNESVGIAAGFFIAAVHQAGLVTLTHTPSPMNFLSKALGRPDNERPYLLMPVGYAAADAKVPDLDRKELTEVMAVYE